MIQEAKSEDSPFRIICELSETFSKQISKRRSDHLKNKKAIKKKAYEYFLMSHAVKEDDRWDYSLFDLIQESLLTVRYHNDKYWPSVHKKVLPVLQKCDDVFSSQLQEEDVIKNTLKFLLILYEYQGHTCHHGIQKYLPLKWFKTYNEINEELETKLKKSHTFSHNLNTDNNFLIDLFKVNEESVYSSFPQIRGLNKSVSWESRIRDLCSGGSLAQPRASTSQTLDEGFVTPDDNHREITPEPPHLPSRKRFWYWEWDIIKSPPPKLKKFEYLGIPLVEKEKRDHLSLMQHYHNKWRANLLLQNIHTPKLCSLLSPQQLYKDVIYLLIGIPSTTFIEDGKSFKLSPGVYVKGIIGPDLELATLPFTRSGEVFKYLERFIKTNYHYDDEISQAFCSVLRAYLLKYQNLVVNTAETEYGSLYSLTIQFSQCMLFLRSLISKEQILNWAKVLDRLFESVKHILNCDLHCLLNPLLIDCTDAYIHLIRRLILNGEISKEINSFHGSVSFLNEPDFNSTVSSQISNQGHSRRLIKHTPKFLEDICKIVNSSSKTLFFLHSDERMLIIKNEVKEKQAKTTVEIPDIRTIHQEFSSQFIKKRELEKQLIRKKKQEEMKRIMDDIACKKEWKDKERLKLQEEENRVTKEIKDLEECKEKLLKQARIELNMKFEQMGRRTEKQIEVARWKLKRLQNERERNEVLKGEEKLERKEIEDYIDGKEKILDEVIKTKKSERPREDEIKDVLLSRDEDAENIKKKIMGSSSVWDFEYKNVLPEKKEIDPEFIKSEYEANRLAALAIKKKNMSTKFVTQAISEPIVVKYRGLSEEEKKEIEKDLICFPNIECTELQDGLKQLLNRWKEKKSLKVSKTYEDKLIESSSFDFVELRYKYLTAKRNSLAKEVNIANEAVLGLIRDKFLEEVDFLNQYYFLSNGLWSGRVVVLLSRLIQEGRPLDALSLTLLNRSMPDNMSFLLRNQPPALDPTAPTSLDCLSLCFRTQWPTNYLITEKIILKYQEIFNFLLIVNRASWLIDQTTVALRLRSAKPHGFHYVKIHMYRHIMGSFMIALRTYFFTNMEKEWNIFKAASEEASSIDKMNENYVTYLKSIMFLCFQKYPVLSETIMKILSCILLFCEVLRCSEWSISNGIFTHSKFRKLTHTFESFQKQAKFIIEYLQRLVKYGYQKSLVNLLSFLTINDFYTTVVVKL